MRKYSVLEHMTPEVASILVYALCEKWEDVTTIIIAKEPVTVEEKEDD